MKFLILVILSFHLSSFSYAEECSKSIPCEINGLAQDQLFDESPTTKGAEPFIKKINASVSECRKKTLDKIVPKEDCPGGCCGDLIRECSLNMANTSKSKSEKNLIVEQPLVMNEDQKCGDMLTAPTENLLKAASGVIAAQAKKLGCILKDENDELTLGIYKTKVSLPVCDGDKFVRAPKVSVDIKCDEKTDEGLMGAGTLFGKGGLKLKAQVLLSFTKECRSCAKEPSLETNHK